MSRKEIVNIQFNGDADFGKVKSAINDVTRTLSRIGKGDNLDKYWDRQAVSIEKVAAAANAFKKDLSNVGNAGGLIKEVNSFLASGHKFEELTASLGKDFSSLFDSANKADAFTSRLFDVRSMQEAQSAFAVLKETGADYISIIESLKKSNEAGSDSAAKLTEYLNEIVDLKTKIKNSDAGKLESERDSLQQQLTEAQRTIQTLKTKAANEFKNFLSANDVSVSSDQATSFIEKITNGTMSAKEAIAEFKAECSNLMPDGGALDTSALDAFGNKLQSILDIVSDVKTKLSTGDFTVGVSSAGDASAAGIERTVNAITEFVSMSGSFDESSSKTASSARELVSSFAQLATAGEGLTKVQGIFSSLNNLNKFKFSKYAKDSIIDLVNGLSESDISKVAKPSDINLEKINDVKFSKSVSDNLISLITATQGMDASNLASLSNIDLSGLNEVKIDKTTVDNVTKLYESMANYSGAVTSQAQITQISEAVTQLSQAVNEISSSLSNIENTSNRVGTESVASVESAEAAVKKYGDSLKYAKDSVQELVKSETTRNADGDIKSTRLEFVDNINNTKTVVKESMEQAGSYVEVFTKKIQTGLDAYKEYMSNTASLNKQRIKLEGLDGGKDTSTYQNIVKAISDAKIALSNYQKNGDMTAFSNSMQATSNYIRQNSIEIDNFSASVKTATQEAKQLQQEMLAGSNADKMRSSVYKQIESLKLKMSNNGGENDQAYKNLEKFSERLTKIYSAFESSDKGSGAFAKFKADMNELAADMNTNAVEIDKFSASVKTATQEAKQLQQEILAESNVDKMYSSVYKQIESLKLKMENNGGENDQSYRNLENFLNRLKEIYIAFDNSDMGSGAFAKFKADMNELAADMNVNAVEIDKFINSIKGVSSKVSLENKTQTKILEIQQLIDKYKELQLTLNGLQDSNDSVVEKGLGADNGASYAEKLKTSIASLEGILNNLKASQLLDDFPPKEGLIAFDTQIKAVKEDINSTVNSIEKLSKAKSLGDSTLKKAASEIGKATNLLSKYSSAETSNKEGSSDAYKSIKEEISVIEGLKEQYESGGLAADKFASAVQQSSTKIQTSVNILNKNGEGISFFDRLGDVTSRLSYWFGATAIMMRCISGMKQMVSASIELNDAMTQLKIVTDETDSSYQKFGQNISAKAQELGVSITDLIDATTTYARLGYTLDESSSLAELTGMLQSVGDIDASDAQDAMTSIIKSFNVDIGDVESTMDKLVSVGNNFPISVSQIAEGMTNASSSLQAAGNTFEQSVALLTGANVSLQDAAKASTGLRTIVARLRNTKTELDDLGEAMTDSEYDKLVQALTNIKLSDGTSTSVSLKDQNGELRNTYDILADIAKVWDKMGSMDQAALAETIAGTRQQNVLYSILNNFKEVSGSYETMTGIESVGALSDAYNTYLESTTAHINALKSAFAGLGSDLFQSSLLSQGADMLTTITNMADAVVRLLNNIGGLNTVLISIGGLGISAALPKILSSFDGIVNCSIALGEVFIDVATGSNTLTGALEALSIGGISAQEAMLGLTLVLTGVVAAYTYFKNKQEEARQSIIDSGKKAISSISSVSEESYNLKNISDAYEAGTASSDEFAEAQNRVREALSGVNQEASDLSGSELFSAYYDSVREAVMLSSAGLEETIKETVKDCNKLIKNGFDNTLNISSETAKKLGMTAEEAESEYGLKIANSIDDVYYNYSQLKRLSSDLKDAGVDSSDQALQRVSSFLSSYESQIKEITSTIDTNNELLAGTLKFGIKTGNIKTLEDYQKVRSILISELEEDPYFNSNGSKTSTQIVDDMLSQITGLKSVYDEFTKMDTVSSAVNSKNRKEIMDWYNSLEDVDKQVIYDMVLTTDGVGKMSLSDLQKYLDDSIPTERQLTVSVSTVTEDVTGTIKSLNSVVSALKEQTTGKGIDIETYNSDEMKMYGDAIEYVNGTMQYNIENVNEITKAKLEEEKATIAANKASDQAKYLENARKIQEKRAELEKATDSQKSSIQEVIDSLLDENNTLANNCNQYDVLTSSINEATSAYQNWINAQGAAQSGDMFDSSKTAIQKIKDTLTNTDSDDYGRIGNADYKAAVDFIVPDKINKEDQAAVSKYIDSIGKYFTYDDNGNAKNMNIEQFCNDAVNAGLMEIDKASNSYKIAGSRTMEDFAEGLGLSLPMVQAMFGEMQEYGGEFDWSDEYSQTFGDIAVKATEAAESLRSLEEYSDIKLVLDVSGFDSVDKAIETLDSNIEQMNEIKAKPGVDASEIEYANDIIRYCIAQKQILTQPDVMTVDTSGVTGAVGELLTAMQEFQTLQNEKEIQLAIDPNVDTSAIDGEIEAARGRVETAFNSLDGDMKASLDIDTSSIESTQASINALDGSTIHTTLQVDSSLISGYEASDTDATVKFDVDSSEVDNFTPDDKNGNVLYSVSPLSSVYSWTAPPKKGIVEYSGTVGYVNGTAHVSGTALASGNWGTAIGGTTLVGELG